MDEEERTDAHQPHHSDDETRDGSVGRHGAEPRLPASTHEAEWQPVFDDEQKGRTQAEHDERMSVHAVKKPAPLGQSEVLAHCQRVDVPDSAAIEIARRRVVDRVSASPEVVRREREHPDRAPDPIVCETMVEEGAMTAIVLDHEQPHEKARSRHRKYQGNPIAKIKACPSEKPE